MPTFTPPTAAVTPPFLPDTKGAEFGLAKYRNVLSAGVVVYKLSDGTYVQDYPTPENSNTNVPPYPLMPDQGPNFPNLISVDYAGGTPTVKSGTRTTTAVNPYVVIVYYGGHSYPVSSAEAAALTAFTAHGIGYGGNLT